MITSFIFDCFGVLAEDGWLPFKRRYLDTPDKLLAVARIGRAVDIGELAHEDMIHETARIAGVDDMIVRTAIGHRVPNERLFTFIRERLKPHYKIGLLSNASYNVLEHLFTPEQAMLFDATTLSYESHLIKPHADIFRLMIERLATTPETCVFIDDQKRHIDGARLVGMRVVTYISYEQCVSTLQHLIDKKP